MPTLNTKPNLAATHTAAGYRATRNNDGSLTIHRIPIFCTCSRGDIEFDDAWVSAAVAKAKQAEREGYLPPLHIRHHEASTEANDSVRAAGFFRILGMETITFKGGRRTAVMADLIITDPAAQHEILGKRLPYRSIEIFNVNTPSIDGLALLDHEAPFLELPMLVVTRIEDKDESEEDGLEDIGLPTFRRPWSMDARSDKGPVVACFRRGATAHLLFREDNTMDKNQFGAGVIEEEPPPLKTKKPSVKFADDDKKDDDKGEDMEGEAGLDVSAVVKAIESGEISVKDMDAILAAIQAQRTEAAPEEEQAPAAVPGVESMKQKPDEMTARMAALQGKVDGLEAKTRARDAADVRRTDVSEAMKRLEGRPLGADLEERLDAFHSEHGPAAFKSYVDAMAQTFGILPGKNGKAELFAGQLGTVPEVAMKYQNKGTDAVDKAARFAGEWQLLRDRGMTRVSEERYVELNMAREVK